MSTDVKLRLAVDGDAQAVKAIGSVERALGSLDGVAGLAKTGLLALGSSLSVGAFIGIAKTFIDAADALNDMSQRVGIAVRDLAKYELAAAQSGTTMEALSKGIKGLSVNMMENGEALKKAGITATNADAAMQQLADVFAIMPDGMEKTTLAVKMFGKSGMDMIPMLNLGSKGLQDAADKSAAYAAQMAAMAPLADAFNDNMAQIGMSSKVVGMTLVNEALPGLLKISTAMAEASVTGGAFAAVWAGISAGFENYKSNVREFWGMQQPSAGGATGSWGEPDKKDPLKEWRKSYEELIAAMGKSSAGADASKKVNDELKKQSDLLAKLSGYSSSYEEDARRLAAMFNSGKLSTEAYNGAINELVNSQPGIKQGLSDQAKALADTAKANEEARKATAQYYDGLAKGLEALDSSNEKLRDQVEEIGLTTEALNTLRLARLDATIAQEEEIYTMASANEASVGELLIMRKRIDLLKEQRSLTATGQDKQAGVDSAKAAFDEWKKGWEATDKLGRDVFVTWATDGSNAAKKIGDTLKTALLSAIYEASLKPMVMQVYTSIMGTGGAAGAANLLGSASGGAGGLSGLLGQSSTLTGLATYGKMFGGALADGWGAAMAGNATGAISGGLSTAAGASGAAGAGVGIGQAIGAAAPYVLAAMAVAEVAKGLNGGSEYTTGTGISGKFSGSSFSGRNYQNWQNDGDKLFGMSVGHSSSGTNYSAMDAALQTTLGTAFGTMLTQTAGFAKQLGASADAVMSYSEDVKLALGSDAAANQKAIEELLKGVSVRAAATVVDAKYIRTGETAADTIARLAISLTAVNSTFEVLNKSLLSVGQAGGDAASILVDLMGGQQAFTASMSSYYQAFYTEEERLAKTREQTTKAFADLNIAMPGTLAGFRDLVNAQDVTTESGRATYAALISLSGAFASFTSVVDQLQTSTVEAATAVKSLLSSLASERASVASAASGINPSPVLTADAIAAGVAKANISSPQLGAVSAATAALATANATLDSAKALATLTSKATNDLATARAANITAGNMLASANATLAGTPSQIWEHYVYNTLFGDRGADRLVANPAYAAAVTARNNAQTQVNAASSNFTNLLNTTGATAAKNPAAQAALQTAAAAKVAAEKALVDRQTEYNDAVKAYTVDAAKSIATLGKLREETVRYYESQKALSELMVTSANNLRGAVSNARGGQLSAAQSLAQQQSTFGAAYSLALSTSGAVQAGYADRLTAALPSLTAALADTAATRADWAMATSQLFAKSESIAALLEANAPKDYQAQSLGLLTSIDNLLGNIGDATQVIVDAVKGGAGLTAAGLREVVKALGGTPAFASGGMHSGGLRLVGENGPELEVTGPSRIFNAAQTRSILGGSGGGNTERLEALVEKQAEQLEAMRYELRAIATSSGKTAQILQRVTPDGTSLQTAVAV